jgi:hypothetical protein
VFRKELRRLYKLKQLNWEWVKHPYQIIQLNKKKQKQHKQRNNNKIKVKKKIIKTTK